MISRVFGATVLVAGLTLVTPAPAQAVPAPVARTNATVTVANMAFTPKTVRISVGDSVTWNFPDAIRHTTTSTQGFWDSGAKSGGESYARTFVSSGTYPYHCSIHAEMQGTVKVPVTAGGIPARGYTLLWSSTGGDANTSYDVQVRKPNSTLWHSFRTDTVKSAAHFNPANPGQYAVRARTTDHGHTSGWSPAKSLTIT